MPQPEAIEAWAKAVAALVTVIALLWRPIVGRLRAWRHRRQEERRMIRYLADTVHALVRDRARRVMPDGDYWVPSADDLAQQAVRTYEQRNALFRADGHEPPRRSIGMPMTEEEVVSLITRTQAIADMREREKTQQLFTDAWPGEGDSK